MAILAPAVALIVAAFVFDHRHFAGWLIRAGILLWAVATAFLFDEPAAEAVDATPRSPSWWFGSRFAIAIPLSIPPAIVAFTWARGSGGLGIAVTVVALILLVAVTSAASRSFGHTTPGDLVASVAGVGIAFLLILNPTVGDLALFPEASGELVANTTTLWLVVASVSGLMFARLVRQVPRPG